MDFIAKQSVIYCEDIGQQEYHCVARCLDFWNVPFHIQEKISKASKKGSKNGWLSKQTESLNMSEWDLTAIFMYECLDETSSTM